MKVDASLVSGTTKQDAYALGCCVQRKFASDQIQLDVMLVALKLGVMK